MAHISRPESTQPFLADDKIAAIASLRKLYLVGQSGSGKSVALATLAHWARTSGWLVRVPSVLLSVSVLHGGSDPMAFCSTSVSLANLMVGQPSTPLLIEQAFQFHCPGFEVACRPYPIPHWHLSSCVVHVGQQSWCIILNIRCDST